MLILLVSILIDFAFLLATPLSELSSTQTTYAAVWAGISYLLGACQIAFARS